MYAEKIGRSEDIQSVDTSVRGTTVPGTVLRRESFQYCTARNENPPLSGTHDTSKRKSNSITLNVSARETNKTKTDLLMYLSDAKILRSCQTTLELRAPWLHTLYGVIQSVVSIVRK